MWLMRLLSHIQPAWGFPGGTVAKDPPANAEDARDTDPIPGLGRSSGGGNGNPLQCSCLENFMGRGGWRVTVRGVANSWTWLSDWVQRTQPAWTTLNTGRERGNAESRMVFVSCVCLSRETKRLNNLPKLTQEAMLPEMKFRIPDTQGAVDY